MKSTEREIKEAKFIIENVYYGTVVSEENAMPVVYVNRHAVKKQLRNLVEIANFNYTNKEKSRDAKYRLSR